MRKSTSLSFGALALAAVVAAGCSGSGITATSTSTPTPTPATGQCVLPSGYTAQQVFPQASGSAVPNLQGVVFAVYPAPLPTNWYFYVTHKDPSSGNILTTLGTAQIGFLATPTPQPTLNPSPGPSPTALVTGTPLPTPSDSPIPALVGKTTSLEIASIGTFANSTTFTVFLANTTCGTGIQFNTFSTNDTDLPSPTPAPSPT
jgi:hypothetical protein